MYIGTIGESRDQTYDEVPGLVGAGEESGRVGVHLVLEPDGGAVFRLPAESVPELVCEDTFWNKEGRYEKHAPSLAS